MTYFLKNLYNFFLRSPAERVIGIGPPKRELFYSWF